MMCKCFNKNKISIYNYDIISHRFSENKLNIKILKDNYIRYYYDIIINYDIIFKILNNPSYLDTKDCYSIIENCIISKKMDKTPENSIYNISINPFGMTKNNCNKHEKSVLNYIYKMYVKILKLMFNKYKLYTNTLFDMIFNIDNLTQCDWIIFNIFIVIKYIIS